MNSYKIRGVKSLSKALDSLTLEMRKRGAQEAVREGAKVVQKEAKLNVPIDSGTLKKSIRVVKRSRRHGDAVYSVVTRAGKRWQASGMDAWYAPFIEFGTENRHRPATPFMRTALDSQKQEVVRTMGSTLREAIRRFAAGYKTKTQAKKAGFK
ncbi:MAG: HK97 gp10 family phage protein [Gammaproteobacteria bacterium]|nr:HK97 gp10 family phage protein [Gammaproteobacteria bacterium]